MVLILHESGQQDCFFLFFFFFSFSFLFYFVENGYVQHIYVPLIYCVLGVKTRLQDITIMYISHLSFHLFSPPITLSSWLTMSQVHHQEEWGDSYQPHDLLATFHFLGWKDSLCSLPFCPSGSLTISSNSHFIPV